MKTQSLRPVLRSGYRASARAFEQVTPHFGQLPESVERQTGLERDPEDLIWLYSGPYESRNTRCVCLCTFTYVGSSRRRQQSDPFVHLLCCAQSHSPRSFGPPSLVYILIPSTSVRDYTHTPRNSHHDAVSRYGRYGREHHLRHRSTSWTPQEL
jgi:hypothetical protein